MSFVEFNNVMRKEKAAEDLFWGNSSAGAKNHLKQWSLPWLKPWDEQACPARDTWSKSIYTYNPQVVGECPFLWTTERKHISDPAVLFPHSEVFFSVEHKWRPVLPLGLTLKNVRAHLRSHRYRESHKWPCFHLQELWLLSGLELSLSSFLIVFFGSSIFGSGMLQV